MQCSLFVYQSLDKPEKTHTQISSLIEKLQYFVAKSTDRNWNCLKKRAAIKIQSREGDKEIK